MGPSSSLEQSRGPSVDLAYTTPQQYCNRTSRSCSGEECGSGIHYCTCVLNSSTCFVVLRSSVSCVLFRGSAGAAVGRRHGGRPRGGAAVLDGVAGLRRTPLLLDPAPVAGVRSTGGRAFRVLAVRVVVDSPVVAVLSLLLLYCCYCCCVAKPRYCVSQICGNFFSQTILSPSLLLSRCRTGR